MIARNKLLAAGLAAGLLSATLGGTLALAQQPPGPGMVQGRQGEMRQGPSDHGPMIMERWRDDRREFNDRIEGRIAFLKAELKITAGQEEAWNRLAEAMRGNSRRMVEARGLMPARDAQLTLAQRLSLRERQMTAMLEGVRSMATAMGQLEPMLTDDQRKTLNDIGPMGLGGPGGPRGRR